MFTIFRNSINQNNSCAYNISIYDTRSPEKFVERFLDNDIIKTPLQLTVTLQVIITIDWKMTGYIHRKSEFIIKEGVKIL